MPGDPTRPAAAPRCPADRLLRVEGQIMNRRIAMNDRQIGVLIDRVEAEAEPGGPAIFKFIIEVKGLDEISHIAAQLKKVKNVTEVIKVNEKVVLK